MTSELFIKFREMIEREFSHAVTKHPKFCDALLDPESRISWAEYESRIKARNAMTKEYADNVLMEEVAEACSAISAGDKEHAKQELAQAVKMDSQLKELINDGTGESKDCGGNGEA